MAICFVIGIFVLANPVWPANFCVETSEELNIALATAASNGQDDVIKIQQSTYNGNFIYASTEAFGTTIEGGYTSGCTSRIIDSTNTVLDAQNDGIVLALSTTEYGNFLIDGISLLNGNHNERGGGLYLNSQGNIVITNSSVNSNYGGSGGGGIYVRDADSVVIQNSNISSNSGSWGGGILIEYVNGVRILNSIINANVSRNDPGGGVRIQNADMANVELIGNIITYNSSIQDGGGLVIREVDSASIINNVIANNTAQTLAGGLHCYRFNILILNNNTIVQNTSTEDGGGIRVWLNDDGDVAHINNNILRGNIAPLGSDLYLRNDPNNNFIPSPVYLSNNDFDQSSVGTYIQIPFPIDTSNMNNVDPSFVDSENDDYHLSTVV